MTSGVAEIRDKIQHVLRKRGVVSAALFGSVARGQQTESSDIDIIVKLAEDRTLLDLSGLRLDLIELMGRDVDVVTVDALHPKLKDRILAELVPIL